MSEKSKINRARRKAREEQQAKHAMKWLTIAMILVAIIFLVIAMTM